MKNRLHKTNISTRNNLLGNKIINFVSFLAIRIAKKNTRIASGSKLISSVFGSGDETKRTK